MCSRLIRGSPFRSFFFGRFRGVNFYSRIFILSRCPRLPRDPEPAAEPTPPCRHRTPPPMPMRDAHKSAASRHPGRPERTTALATTTAPTATKSAHAGSRLRGRRGLRRNPGESSGRRVSKRTARTPTVGFMRMAGATVGFSQACQRATPMLQYTSFLTLESPSTPASWAEV